MGCETVSVGDSTVLVCRRGRRHPKCSVCKRRDGTQLCDGKPDREAEGTCDAPLCMACSVRPGGDRDFCPGCAQRAGLKSKPLDLGLPRTVPSG